MKNALILLLLCSAIQIYSMERRPKRMPPERSTSARIVIKRDDRTEGQDLIAQADGGSSGRSGTTKETRTLFLNLIRGGKDCQALYLLQRNPDLRSTMNREKARAASRVRIIALIELALGQTTSGVEPDGLAELRAMVKETGEGH